MRLDEKLLYLAILKRPQLRALQAVAVKTR